jgi:hypothetical protein
MINSRRGNALTEYALPMTLLVGATALVILNGSPLSNWFQNILTRSVNGGMVGSRLVVNSLSHSINGQKLQPTSGSADTAATLSVNNPPPSVQPTAAKGSITITLANGEKLTLNNYPTNMSELVETAGASGTTIQLAQFLEQYAQQLAAKGLITTDQNSQIIELANMAHTMARVQRVMEDKVQEIQKSDINFATPRYLYDETLIFDGVAYKPSNDLVAMIDVLPGTDAQGVQNGGEFMYAFQKKFNDIFKSGLNWDTPQGIMFTKLVETIIVNVDDTPGSWFQLNHLHEWTEPQRATNKNVLTTHQSSNTTHDDATGLCKAGQGQDKRFSCEP